jgi:hypothetical protein
MPNRNAFVESEKYDHSSHSTTRRQRGDLQPPGGGAGNDAAKSVDRHAMTGPRRRNHKARPD